MCIELCILFMQNYACRTLSDLLRSVLEDPSRQCEICLPSTFSQLQGPFSGLFLSHGTPSQCSFPATGPLLTTPYPQDPSQPSFPATEPPLSTSSQLQNPFSALFTHRSPSQHSFPATEPLLSAPSQPQRPFSALPRAPGYKYIRSSKGGHPWE